MFDYLAKRILVDEKLFAYGKNNIYQQRGSTSIYLFVSFASRKAHRVAMSGSDSPTFFHGQPWSSWIERIGRDKPLSKRE